MNAVTDAVRVAAPSNPVDRSIRDSQLVARRNLVGMSRIPDPVRSYRSGFISPRIRDLDVSGLEAGGRGLRLPAPDGAGARWPDTSKEQAQ